MMRRAGALRSVAGITGSVAAVTGGGSGIGEAAARKLAALGALVAVLDRDIETGTDVVAAINADGGTARFVPVDVTDSDQCAAAFEQVISELGGLDIAVNNAGIVGRRKPVFDYDDGDWREVLSTNLDGVFYCIRAQTRQMIGSGGGSIVNTASMFSTVARADYPAYVSAKHGVLGLTRAAALDCAGLGVRVNCVAPGVVETPLLVASTTEQERAARGALHPLGRLCRPDEVAGLITWLCSEESAFVTGGIYAIDGGFTVR
jgi:2-dehydro-3-deoxy-L-rhamnonate dehydrogenase (NAD+)